MMLTVTYFHGVPEYTFYEPQPSQAPCKVCEKFTLKEVEVKVPGSQWLQ